MTRNRAVEVNRIIVLDVDDEFLAGDIETGVETAVAGLAW